MIGMPLAELWVYFTTGEWIDLMSPEGQLQAAGFTFVSIFDNFNFVIHNGLRYFSIHLSFKI